MNNYAFIDSQNVHLSIRSQGWEVDWKRFRIYLSEHYKVSKAFLFIGYVNGNEELYKDLERVGFVCVFKPTLKYRDGSIKGNVDAELVLHTMIRLEDFNRAVIVTGDGDFHCLIEYLIQKDKLLTVLIPNMFKYSALLKRFAKKQIAFMNSLKGKIESK